MLKLELWHKAESSGFLSRLCFSLIEVFNIAPLKRLPIALNGKQKCSNCTQYTHAHTQRFLDLLAKQFQSVFRR